MAGGWPSLAVDERGVLVFSTRFCGMTRWLENMWGSPVDDWWLYPSMDDGGPYERMHGIGAQAVMAPFWVIRVSPVCNSFANPPKLPGLNGEGDYLHTLFLLMIIAVFI